MGQPLAYFLEAMRSKLRDTDSDAYNWDDNELTVHLQQAVREISRFCPRGRKAAIKTVATERDIDISDLDDLVYIDLVEYPIDQYPKRYKNFKVWGDTLTLDISGAPSGTETTLTGTVTFTKDSTAVSGVGTDFDGECVAGAFIRNVKAGDTICYKIASVTSDTALVLSEAYRGATAADTADSTGYRESTEVVYVYYGALHEIGPLTSTMPSNLDQLVIDGAVAFAAADFIGKGRGEILEAIDKFSDVDTALDAVVTRITAAVAYLESGDDYIAKEHAAADTAIDNMAARITQAVEDIASGRSLLNTLALGGAGVPSDYINYAARELDGATTYLNQAKGFLAEDQPAGEYLSYAAHELSAGAGRINEARGHLGMVTGRLNGASLVERYHKWAQAEIIQFKQNCIRERKERKIGVHPS